MASKKAEQALEKLKAEEDKRRKKYKEREKALNARIKRQNASSSARDRKQDTRRKILIGGWVLGQLKVGLEINIKDEAALKKALDTALTRKTDRELFELQTK
jgi:hypothetical protein